MELITKMRALVVLLVVLLATGCGASEVAEDPEEYVYKVRFHIEADPSCADASCVTVKYLEWVAPNRGWWRAESADGTGFATTQIYARNMHVTDHNDGPPSVRIGSPVFLGYLAEPSLGLRALQGSEPWEVGDMVQAESRGRPFSATIEERITLEEAERRGIFAIPEKQFDLHRELAPGEQPTLAVQPYWFGPSIAGREAVTATEGRFTDNDGEVLTYTTRYELPSAGGKSSAQPGQTPPQGEIQVVSQPVDGWRAQKASNAPADRKPVEVTLANGEDALLYVGPGPERSVTVVTKSTAVSFTGIPLREARQLARKLRPL